MSTCISITLSPEEEAATLSRIDAKALAGSPTGSRCEACGKVLEETEQGIRGYASGHELGLCRKDASYVNTPEAIDRAEKEGHKVHSRPVLAPASGGTTYEGDDDA